MSGQVEVPAEPSPPESRLFLGGKRVVGATAGPDHRYPIPRPAAVVDQFIADASVLGDAGVDGVEQLGGVAVDIPDPVVVEMVDDAQCGVALP